VKMKNFWGTKSRRKFLGLKRKVGILIGTKNIFNPKKFHLLKCIGQNDILTAALCICDI